MPITQALINFVKLSLREFNLNLFIVMFYPREEIKI